MQKLVFSALLVFWSNFLSAQPLWVQKANQIVNAYWNEYNVEVNKKEIIQRAKTCLNKWPKEQYLHQKSDLLNVLGNALYNCEAYTEAAQIHRENLQLRLKIYGEGHPLVANTQQNLANSLKDQGYWTEAIAYYQSAWAMKARLDSLTLQDKLPALLNLADAYREHGDFGQAAQAYQQACSFIADPAHEEWLYCQYYAADCLYQYGQFDLAEKALVNYWALQVWSPEIIQSELGVKSHILLADLYFNQQQHNKAFNTLNQVQMEDLPPSLRLLIALKLVEFYRRQGSYVEAEQALSITAATLDLNSLSIDETTLFFWSWGEMLRSTGDYGAAKTKYRKGLSIIKPEHRLWTECWIGIAKTALKEQKLSELGAALTQARMNEPDTVMSDNYHLVAGEYQSAMGHLGLAQQHYQIVAARYKGMDNNRSYLLAQCGWFTCFLKKPQQDKIQQVANKLEQIINTQLDATENDRESLALLRRLVNLGIQSQLLSGDTLKAFLMVEQLKRRYAGLQLPGQLKDAQHTLFKPKVLQTNPDQTVLVYHWMNDELLIFCLNGGSVRLVRQADVKPLVSDQVARFYDFCHTAPDTNSQPSDTLVQIGKQLFQTLIAPLQPYLTQELFIVPDGVLHFLPFEALVEQSADLADDFSNHRYLLHRCNVAYLSSVESLRHKDRKPLDLKQLNSLAIGPIFGTPADGLSKLYFNRQEADSVHQIWGGTLLLNEQAALDYFSQNAARYHIIHLSTHGYSNWEAPHLSWIAFSGEDQKQYATEIGSMPLDQTRLVVLSACQTALGDRFEGEQIESLSLAFQRAGVWSVLAALWNVDDAQSPALMTRFHRLLSQGMSKHEALTIAKRDYLNRVGSEQAHPYYWASLLLHGDTEPLVTPPLNYWAIAAWGSLLLMAAGLLYYAYRTRYAPLPNFK
jgi:CHAT domain-containing protein